MATLRQQRLTQAAADTTAKAVAEQSAKAEYYITDPAMKNIGNVRLKPGQKTVVLSYGEARLFLGQGLDTVSPEDRAKQAEEAAAKDQEHRAEFERREAARVAKAEENAAKAEGKAADGDGKPSGTGEPATPPAAPTGSVKRTTGR